MKTWTRPISPVIKSYFSYAVAFVSRRTDGAPYSVDLKLSELGLNNRNGYILTVKCRKIIV